MQMKHYCQLIQSKSAWTMRCSWREASQHTHTHQDTRHTAYPRPPRHCLTANCKVGKDGVVSGARSHGQDSTETKELTSDRHFVKLPGMHTEYHQCVHQPKQNISRWDSEIFQGQVIFFQARKLLKCLKKYNMTMNEDEYYIYFNSENSFFNLSERIVFLWYLT